MSDGFSLPKSINSLVDDGWLAVLGCTELAVLIVYIKCANQDGVAWPGTIEIMTKLGHGTRSHIWVARQKLESRGLLKRLPDLEGKIRYQVCRPTAPESAPLPNRDFDRSRIGTNRGAESGAKNHP